MENKLETIPYVVHEGDMARLERSNRRLLIALAIALAIMFLNNVAWLIYEHAGTNARMEYSISETQP